MVSVAAKPTESGWTCTVAVTEKGSTTHHTVHVSKFDLERWGRGGSPEELVRRSFEFLLQREPKEAILRTFDLSVIQRYFPDYSDAMTG